MTMSPAATPINASDVVSQDAHQVDAMREDLGHDLFADILETLFVRSEADLAACRQAQGAGNEKALMSAAHSMKGALLGLGFNAAAAIADTLQAGRSAQVDRDIDGLEAVMREIRRCYGNR